jgi:hypothetical protein
MSDEQRTADQEREEIEDLEVTGEEAGPVQGGGIPKDVNPADLKAPPTLPKH